MKKLFLILFAIFTLSFVSCSNEDDFIEPSTTVYVVEQRVFHATGMRFETSRVYKIENCKLEETGQYESFKKSKPCIKCINKISLQGSNDYTYDYQSINNLQEKGYSILKTDGELFAYKTVAPTSVSCDCSISFNPVTTYLAQDCDNIIRFSWENYYKLRDEIYDIWLHNIFDQDFLTVIDNRKDISTYEYSCKIVTDESKLQQHTAEFNPAINSTVTHYEVHYNDWNNKQ